MSLELKTGILGRELCKIDIAVEKTLFFDISYKNTFLKFEKVAEIPCMKY